MVTRDPRIEENPRIGFVLDAVVYPHEGGYVNNPHDNGGETNRGITEATARRHGYQGDMRDLPIAVSDKIYINEYVTDRGFDNINHLGTMSQVVSTGVMSGKYRTILSAALGSNEVLSDEEIVTRINERVEADGTGAQEFASSLRDARISYYQTLGDWQHFGNGWTNRANDETRLYAVNETGDAAAKSAIASAEKQFDPRSGSQNKTPSRTRDEMDRYGRDAMAANAASNPDELLGLLLLAMLMPESMRWQFLQDAMTNGLGSASNGNSFARDYNSAGGYDDVTQLSDSTVREAAQRELNDDASLRNEVVQQFLAFEGMRELKGNRGDMVRLFNGYEGDPWCGGAVDKVIDLAFEKATGKPLTTSANDGVSTGRLSAAYYKHVAQDVERATGENAYFKPGEQEPQAGDVVLFSVPSNASGYHVGMVTKVEDGRVYYAAGNEGQKVVHRSYSLNNQRGGSGPVAGYADLGVIAQHIAGVDIDQSVGSIKAKHGIEAKHPEQKLSAIQIPQELRNALMNYEIVGKSQIDADNDGVLSVAEQRAAGDALKKAGAALQKNSADIVKKSGASEAVIGDFAKALSDSGVKVAESTDAPTGSTVIASAQPVEELKGRSVAQ